MQKIKTLNDVLKRLETIIDWAKEQHSPLGYFPVVYHLMTKAVQQGIEDEHFEDGARMERLDVVFARRYFVAFDAWQAGKPCTQAWAMAFEAAENKKLTVLQHILLGINAHIHLDLGIAAAEIQEGKSIFELQTDFNRINDVISSLVDPTQDRLAQIFPLFWVLDWVLRSRDERFANQIVSLGRSGAWTVATTLAALENNAQALAIEKLDKGVMAIGNRILAPGGWLTPAFRLAYFAELGTVRTKIEKLQAAPT